MGLGFVTDVAVTAARLPWLGDTGYAAGVLHRVLGLKPHRLTLAVDGQSVMADNCFVEVCNSRYTGGAMCMAPYARLDDGFFDVVLLAPLSRLKLIASFPRIYRGTHGSLKEIRFIRARRATIVTAPAKRLMPDGEVFGVTPTRVDVLPRRVACFSPTTKIFAGGRRWTPMGCGWRHPGA